MPWRLNLGCGTHPIRGFVNVDFNRYPGLVQADAHALPFRDNSFELIWASHVLEHVHDIVRVMAELYRVAKRGAILDIWVPNFQHISAFADPTHVRFFTEASFDQWAVNQRRYSFDYQVRPKERFLIESIEKQYDASLLTRRFLWHIEHRLPEGLRPLAHKLVGHTIATLRFRLVVLKTPSAGL